MSKKQWPMKQNDVPKDPKSFIISQLNMCNCDEDE